MSELTTVSGFFVLAILLGYTTASAFMFTAWEPDWSFLDAFYFCLITMVRARPLIFRADPTQRRYFLGDRGIRRFGAPSTGAWQRSLSHVCDFLHLRRSRLNYYVLGGWWISCAALTRQ